MRRPGKRLAIAFLIVCVYLLWQPEPTRRELTLDPLWALTPASAPVDAQAAAGDAAMIPFIADDVFGYLTASGKLAYRGRASYRVALSERAFVNASRGSEQLVIQDVAGGFVSSLPTSGDPIFVGERLFVVSDGGGTLSEWSVNGARLWQVPLAAPLLSVAASDTHTGLGMVAGGAVLLDASGDPLDLRRPTVRVEPIVYSLALSDSSPGLAVVSGAAPGVTGAIEGDSVPATLTLYDFSGGHGVPVVRRAIARDPGAEPVVRLLARGTTLLYSDARPEPVLVILGVADGDEYLVRLDHPAADVIELARPGLHATLEVGSERDPSRSFARPAGLVVATNTGVVVARVTWAADQSWIRRSGPVTVIGVDDRIVSFTMGVR